MFSRKSDSCDRRTTTKPARLSAITFSSPMISRGVLFTGVRPCFTLALHIAPMALRRTTRRYSRLPVPTPRFVELVRQAPHARREAQRGIARHARQAASGDRRRAPGRRPQGEALGRTAATRGDMGHRLEPGREHAAPDGNGKTSQPTASLSTSATTAASSKSSRTADPLTGCSICPWARSSSATPVPGLFISTLQKKSPWFRSRLHSIFYAEGFQERSFCKRLSRIIVSSNRHLLF
jgi:hypothetical protein